MHIVLLGDSVFDNAAYVPGQPAVIDQLRSNLPDGWEATLLAADGSMTSDVLEQLEDLPPIATHLIVSAGGNDAITCSSILNRKFRSPTELFLELADMQDRFRTDYQTMLDAVLAREVPTAVCTIYDAVPFPDPAFRRVATVALSIFNDCVIRLASEHDLPVLDMRRICSEPEDFSSLSPIEPSHRGGAKIVAAIVRLLSEFPMGAGRFTMYW